MFIHMPLKKAYYLMFLVLVITPITGVLILVLLLLNQQFKQQSLENIKQSQQTVITQLMSDINTMSMRMSVIVHANDYELLHNASMADTDNMIQKSEYRKKLSSIENLYLDPEKNILSFYFYMNDGSDIYLKSYIKKNRESIEKEKWYQNALKNKNIVHTGSYKIEKPNDLFFGSEKDMFILVFALAPDITTDKSGKIKMVELYQYSNITEMVKTNNKEYHSGKNKFGVSQITDADGNCIFSTEDNINTVTSGKYICISTPVNFYGNTWYIENYILPKELTQKYWETAICVLATAVAVLLLTCYFSRYFIKSIIKPIEAVNYGLRQVEEGKLDVWTKAEGQFEIRNMIHQFNAMTRRLKALIQEYEEKAQAGRNGEFYFKGMLSGQLTPKETIQEYKGFFMEPYSIIAIYASGSGEYITTKLSQSFRRNPRYASRCFSYEYNAHTMYLFYRISEKDYISSITGMVKELQKTAENELHVQLFVCIGKHQTGFTKFNSYIDETKKNICLRYLLKENQVIDTEHEFLNRDIIIKYSAQYKVLANALFIADEKKLVQERDSLFDSFHNDTMEQMKEKIYGVIIAVGQQFSENNISLAHIFGQQYDYTAKINRIPDARGLRLWITNYFEWIMQYSADKLSIHENDMVVKAKRYIANNYENPELTLSTVAKYVGLNEKYFTNRFSKESGETFSNYLTGIRMQKSKELLKNTTFKVYEIAEMSGYNNVENFNRVFKKNTGISPTQYRKSE